ncbi:MAG TPA: NAD(P)/FAD-dependent oxidoreductase [Symbiobacteriaceae bacterium]|nr:NAD(P)/FAD-dependent oxidoreductase [Symbiobacteriaceae bacterium]
MSDFDVVLVGSGINSLVCGAMLAKAGWRVGIFERNGYLGGAIRTEEITRPGFKHDLFAAWHPLFVGSPAYAELKDDLVARGLVYLNTELPTASLYPDGDAAFLTTSPEKNVAELERLSPGDGQAWLQFLTDFAPNMDLVFRLLGTNLWSADGAALLQEAVGRLGPEGLQALSGEALSSCRAWLTTNFASPKVHGLLAPWVLHTGLSPEAPYSGMMTQVTAAALQTFGCPIPRGGSARLVDALVRLIEDCGGECHENADVVQVLVENGRATGIRLKGGETVTAARAVIANVTPSQLYLRLLDESLVPPATLRGARRFRHGLGDMQIHMALSEPPKWLGDERLAGSALVNITAGLDGVSKSVNEATRSLLPAKPTICCGQPMAIDPSRAPDGTWILWIQLLDMPNHPVADAAEKIPFKGPGWTDDLKERYADRVQKMLSRRIGNLESALLDRVVLSPADLEKENINLVGGDPYGGALDIAQHFLWRPFPGRPGHQTPVAGLFHIGASTYPGHGLGAGSGTMVAKQLLAGAYSRDSGA